MGVTRVAVVAVPLPRRAVNRGRRVATVDLADDRADVIELVAQTTVAVHPIRTPDRQPVGAADFVERACRAEGIAVLHPVLKALGGVLQTAQ